LAKKTMYRPMASVATKNAPLSTCWPRMRQVLSILPSSLAYAISEPESEIAPMSAPTTVTSSGTSACVALVRRSSTAAMAAAAPPPMPL
jgi:hypothetical protein